MQTCSWLWLLVLHYCYCTNLPCRVLQRQSARLTVIEHCHMIVCLSYLLCSCWANVILITAAFNWCCTPRVIYIESNKHTKWLSLPRAQGAHQKPIIKLYVYICLMLIQIPTTTGIYAAELLLIYSDYTIPTVRQAIPSRYYWYVGIFRGFKTGFPRNPSNLV